MQGSPRFGGGVFRNTSGAAPTLKPGARLSTVAGEGEPLAAGEPID